MSLSYGRCHRILQMYASKELSSTTHDIKHTVSHTLAAFLLLALLLESLDKRTVSLLALPYCHHADKIPA